MKREDITPELVRELLDCNYETGELTWKRRYPHHYIGKRDASKGFNTRYAGKPAFNGLDLSSKHYRGDIFRVGFAAHHVVWSHYYGRWPTMALDHIKGTSAGNGIANLREVTPEQNSRNMKLRKGHPTGVYGVRYDPCQRKYVATIGIGKGRTKYLGAFKEKAIAVAKRKAAEREYGYSEFHGRLTA